MILVTVLFNPHRTRYSDACPCARRLNLLSCRGCGGVDEVLYNLNEHISYSNDMDVLFFACTCTLHIIRWPSVSTLRTSWL